MCLDKRAMKSYAAWKGWQTRRAREAKKASMTGPASPDTDFKPTLTGRGALPDK